MTRLERNREQLKKYEHQHYELLCNGRFVEAAQLAGKMDGLLASIEAEEAAQSVAVGEVLKHDAKALDGAILRCVKLHFAADYVARCAYELHDFLRDQDLNLKTFTSELKQLAKDAERLAGRLVKKDGDFEEMLVNNHTLLQAIDKKTESYLNQRMKKKKQKSASV